MNIILEDRGVGGFQRKQVFIAGFDRLQLVLRVLGLPLMGEEKKETEYDK